MRERRRAASKRRRSNNGWRKQRREHRGTESLGNEGKKRSGCRANLVGPMAEDKIMRGGGSNDNEPRTRPQRMAKATPKGGGRDNNEWTTGIHNQEELVAGRANYRWGPGSEMPEEETTMGGGRGNDGWRRRS